MVKLRTRSARLRLVHMSRARMQPQLGVPTSADHWRHLPFRLNVNVCPLATNLCRLNLLPFKPMPVGP